MTTLFFTKGDLARGRAPNLTSPPWRHSLADLTTGPCAHGGHTATTSSTRATRSCGAPAGPPTSSAGPGETEHTMVVDGYTWIRVPGKPQTRPADRLRQERPLTWVQTQSTQPPHIQVTLSAPLLDRSLPPTPRPQLPPP
ncbi:MAG: hypothetical protein ACRDRQ_15470 [Pseudonocardiaceae bacterium]